MRYRIKDDISISMDENGVISLRDLSRLAMIVGGFNPALQGGSFDVFSDGKLNLIVSYDPSLELEELAAEHDATPYNPLADKSLAQSIMRQFNIMLTPLTTVDGNLAAAWKAERIGPYNGLAKDAPLLSSDEEPLSCVNDNANVAIFLCAGLHLGIGRTAYVAFDAAGNAVLLHRATEHAQSLVDHGLGNTIFHAPELDEYNVSGAANEIVAASIARCRDLYDVQRGMQAGETLDDARLAEPEQRPEPAALDE